MPTPNARSLGSGAVRGESPGGSADGRVPTDEKTRGERAPRSPLPVCGGRDREGAVCGLHFLSLTLSPPTAALARSFATPCATSRSTSPAPLFGRTRTPWPPGSMASPGTRHSPHPRQSSPPAPGWPPSAGAAPVPSSRTRLPAPRHPNAGPDPAPETFVPVPLRLSRQMLGWSASARTVAPKPAPLAPSCPPRPARSSAPLPRSLLGLRLRLPPPPQPHSFRPG
jgi:hypothetical protein